MRWDSRKSDDYRGRHRFILKTAIIKSGNTLKSFLFFSTQSWMRCVVGLMVANSETWTLSKANGSGMLSKYLTITYAEIKFKISSDTNVKALTLKWRLPGLQVKLDLENLYDTMGSVLERPCLKCCKKFL